MSVVLSLVGRSVGRPSRDEMVRWSDILERAGFWQAVDVRDCGNKDVWFETCSVNVDHGVIKHSWHCKNLKFCPDDAFVYANRKAVEAVRFIRMNIADSLSYRLYMIKLDLTVPHCLDSMPRGEFVYMRDELLRRYYGSDLVFGGLMVVHLDSTSDPGVKHLQMHNNVLNVALKEVDGGFKVVRLKPYLNQVRIRGLWREIVNERLVSRGLKVVDEVDLWVNYVGFPFKGDDKEKVAEAEGKLRHRLRYVYRLGVWDVFNKFVRSEGQYVAGGSYDLQMDVGSGKGVGEAVYVHKKKLGFFEHLLFDKRPKASWFGYLSNVRRKSMMKVFNVEPYSMKDIRQIIKEEEILQKGKCRICGAPLRIATDFEVRKAGYDPPDKALKSPVFRAEDLWEQYKEDEGILEN